MNTTSTKKKKAKAQIPPQNVTKNDLGSKDSSLLLTQRIPMTSYISIVGVHTTLWMFVALYLPRTKLFLGELVKSEWPESQTISRDQPQHPFLEPLTVNPASTLLYMSMGAVVLQSWWAGWLREWWLKLGIRGTEDEKRTEIAHLNGQKMAISMAAWASTMAASFMIHCILVLFGAPIASHCLKTYLLALLISIMTVYPPAYTLGAPSLGNSSASVVKRWTWVRLFAEFSIRNPIERDLVYSAVGTVAGCWLGIIPIALDWGRPWQAWPLTPAFGAVGGYVVSSLITLTVSAVIQLAEDHKRAGTIPDQKSQ